MEILLVDFEKVKVLLSVGLGIVGRIKRCGGVHMIHVGNEESK